MRIAETKALISFVVTAKLICIFVFAYAKSRFSQDTAHVYLMIMKHFAYLSLIHVCAHYNFRGC